MRRPPALILAAGRATRMEPYSREMPKSLFELAPGLAIMDLTLRWLREEGIQRVVIVTRPSLVEAFRERYGDSVEIVATDAEEGFGNLYSLRAGMEALDSEEFLLLMSDHVFEPDILRRLLRKGGGAAFTLCLDRNPPWDKIEEGLKVVVRDGRVEQVGKRAPPYYGVDTGLFYCAAGAKRIVEETIAEIGPKATVADALRRAIREGEVDYVDVTGLLWMDVDTPEELGEARRILPRLLRRSLLKPGDGPVSRYMNRPISTRISVWLFLRGISVSPNLISAVSFLTCVGGAALLALGGGVLGGVLVQLSSILDGVDGEVARLFQRASGFGKVFDALLDRYADLAVVAASGLAMWPLDSIGLLTLAAAAGNVFVTSYVSHLAGWGEDPRVVEMRAWSPAGRDVRLLVAAMAAIAGRLDLFLIYMATVPAAFSAALVWLVLAGPGPGRPAFERPERREPVPRVEARRVGRRRRLRRAERALGTLLSSAIKLTLALFIIRVVERLIVGFGPVLVGPFQIVPADLLAFAELVAVVYFGYRILMALKYLVDLTSGWLVRKLGAVTEAAVNRALVDLLYLSFLTVLMWIAPPRVSSLPGLGELAERIVLLVLLVFFVLIVYDLMKLFYRSFRGAYERMVARLAEKLRAVEESRSKAEAAQ